MKIFEKIFLYFAHIFSQAQKFMGVKNFKRFLISIPKCIELNSEFILGLGLGSHPGPRINIYFFWGEMSAYDIFAKNRTFSK